MIPFERDDGKRLLALRNLVQRLPPRLLIARSQCLGPAGFQFFDCAPTQKNACKSGEVQKSFQQSIQTRKMTGPRV